MNVAPWILPASAMAACIIAAPVAAAAAAATNSATNSASSSRVPPQLQQPPPQHVDLTSPASELDNDCTILSMPVKQRRKTIKARVLAQRLAWASLHSCVANPRLSLPVQLLQQDGTAPHSVAIDHQATGAAAEAFSYGSELLPATGRLAYVKMIERTYRKSSHVRVVRCCHAGCEQYFILVRISKGGQPLTREEVQDNQASYKAFRQHVCTAHATGSSAAAPSATPHPRAISTPPKKPKRENSNAAAQEEATERAELLARSPMFSTVAQAEKAFPTPPGVPILLCSPQRLLSLALLNGTPRLLKQQRRRRSQTVASSDSDATESADGARDVKRGRRA